MSGSDWQLPIMGAAGIDVQRFCQEIAAQGIAAQASGIDPEQVCLALVFVVASWVRQSHPSWSDTDIEAAIGRWVERAVRFRVHPAMAQPPAAIQ